MEVHDRLRQARIRAGFTRAREAADRFAWNRHTYTSHENGIRGLKLDVAEKYARAFKVSPGWLLTGFEENSNETVNEVTTIPVYSSAAGGVWLEEADTQATDTPEVAAVPHSKFSPSTQYARKVVGNSVSNRIADGDYAIMVRYESFPGQLENGMLVDVKRTRADGLTEHSIKMFEDGYLITDSAHLEGQRKLPMDNGEDGTEVTVTGIVIAAQKSLL